MAMNIDPHERFIRRTALALLLTAGLGAMVAFVMHTRQAAPQTIDLVMSTGLATAFLGLSVFLWLRPNSLGTVSWLGFLVSLLGLVVPAWYYPIHALRVPGA